MRPFFLTGASQFRSPPPPAFASPAYLTALAELRQIADTRTPEQTAIAKFWASEGGARISYAAQHLHGGIGVDVDYPVHRYYLWARQIGLHLGTGSAQLAKLGERLAAS